MAEYDPVLDFDFMAPAPATPPKAANLCKDCGIFKASWAFAPCGCVGLCGRCVQIRKLAPAGYTVCPGCDSVNKGRFKHE